MMTLDTKTPRSPIPVRQKRFRPAAALRALFGRRVAVIDRVAAVIIVLLIAFALLGLFYQPFDPYETDPRASMLPPGGQHLLGTDSLGRDVLSRLLAGSAETIFLSLGVVLVATVIGVAIASIAAVCPRFLDNLIMRTCDVFFVVPSLVLALSVAAALGPSAKSAAIATVVALAPGTARLTRGVLRETLGTAYVEAARTMGMSRGRALVVHGLPNSLDAVIVQASTETGGVIVLLAGLAYLGAGAPPPSANWGAMVADGQGYITTAWWVVLPPGLAITIAAIAFGLMGDAIRARMDPTMAGRST